MQCDLVLGGQWGDEGKGKIVDVLAAGAAAVVRCQGGANAGHTLVVGDRSIALHLVPSGVRHPGCLVVLGNGMVVDPLALLEELDTLAAAGIDLAGRVRASTRAHVVLPCHRLQDQVEERRRGAASVGTTGRGIGPAYADKASRNGVQLGVFALPEPETRSALVRALEMKRRALAPEADFEVEPMVEQLLACRERLVPLLADTTALVHDLWSAGERILLEGAQGALLDLDHGSYPYVTSSSCTSAGALAGAGLPPQAAAAVVGVVKAYATRVGNGPFPTEETGAAGERLRRLGREYGATTGRPRRCGWFDAVAARHAARVNGFTELALTKLDILDDFETIRVADSYLLDGARVERYPADAAVLSRAVPVYAEVEGWRRSTRDCRTPGDLPPAARRYLEFLEARVGVPIGLVSVGPERDRTFRWRDPVGA
jgi:adenylosuccinate synthase